MFKTRIEAGKLLGEKIREELVNEKLTAEDLKDKVIVLGIPRGGVVIGKEVADVLKCSLDVIVVKKLGAPSHSELAIGSVGETEGSLYVDNRLVKELGVKQNYIDDEIKRKKQEIKRREEIYRQGNPPLDLKDKIVIIVDDGSATGATAIAAVKEVWNNVPKRVIIGLPVVARDTLKKLEKEVDEVIYLNIPVIFYAVGEFYQNFPQLEDEEVIEILKNSHPA